MKITFSDIVKAAGFSYNGEKITIRFDQQNQCFKIRSSDNKRKFVNLEDLKEFTILNTSYTKIPAGTALVILDDHKKIPEYIIVMGKPQQAKLFYAGQQIAYVPSHAEGDLRHVDVEFGFIEEIHPEGDSAWCRYWRKGYPGDLRTRSNRELTYLRDISPCISVDQYIVDNLMKSLAMEQEMWKSKRQ